MKIFATAALFLLFFFSSSSTEEAASQGPRLFFCPGYRAVPANANGYYDGGREPFRFVVSEGRGIVLASSARRIEIGRAISYPRFRFFGRNFFGCLVYNLAAFSHHVLDYFLPYYGYPYYRSGPEPNGIPIPVHVKPAK